MDNFLRTENLVVNYTKELYKYKENDIFKLFIKNKVLYAADFSGNILFPLELKNQKDLTFDLNTPHFVRVLDSHMKNNYGVLEIYLVNKSQVNTDKISILHKPEQLKNKTNLILNCSTEKAILVGAKNSVENKNDENIVIIDPISNNAYYLLQKTEVSDNTNLKERKFLELGNKIKNFNFDEYYFGLFVGEIELTTNKVFLESKTEDIINILNKDINNYLKVWEKYNEIEKVVEFDRLREQKYIQVEKITTDNKIKLWFDDENFSKLKGIKDSMLILGNNTIKSLFKLDSFKDYIAAEREGYANKDITRCIISDASIDNTLKSVTVVVDDQSVLQKIENGNIYLCCSLLGTATMFKRREQAKNAIIKKFPLNTLFTEDPKPNSLKEHIDINYELIKDIQLTENQKTAIEIICNTPDIAIIQGPPGTGKTTVINAAITQINNKEKLKTNKYANNLVSGFRHETVQNIASKVKLYGLPAIKVGEKEKDKVNATKELETQIIQYIDDLNDNLDKEYNDLFIKDDEFKQFISLYQNLKLFANSIDTTIYLLKEIEKLDIVKYNYEYINKIESKIKDLSKKDFNNPLKSIFLDFLYNLPYKKACFYDMKNYLEEQFMIFEDEELFKDDVKTLKKLYNTDNINFESIKDTRRRLIIKYLPTPKVITSNSHKDQICGLLDEIYNQIMIDRLKSYDGKDLAILNYKESLQENPYLIKETLLRYTKVLGSTNQQTYSKEVFDSLPFFDDKHLSFDNVFIDEAATSSPLDLFIPMSVANDRLVLVGDHKQLPHITNKNITALLQKYFQDIDVEKMTEDTLFKYLIDKAHQLEKIDGKQRVITLNNQFRMHPKLGDLISRHFYQEEGGLYSPKGEDEFRHNYHNLTNKYLHWIDNKEDNIRDNGSRFNINEAELIAKHIKEALDSPSYNKESIGVITFYKSQVDKIKYELKEIGVFAKNGTLNQQYQDLKIEVGTVDAFQGKEFDIVYLATTYTSSINNPDIFKTCRINNKSLLCVAVSRQKKLLIVVGNKELYHLNNAKEYASVLYEINKICNGD